jgi:hypothetical protein
MQHIVVGGGNCCTAWDMQLDGLNLAWDFFSCSLKMPVAGKSLGSTLRLNRNIFTKVCFSESIPYYRVLIFVD